MKDNYIVGDIVWAKLKGYPWWPARIEREKDLADNVLSKKPKNTNPAWPVFFFGSQDYGWFSKDQLRPFDEFKSELCSPPKKSGQFSLALRQAENPGLLDSAVPIAKGRAPASKKKTEKAKINVEDDDSGEGYSPNRKEGSNGYKIKEQKSSSNSASEVNSDKKVVLSPSHSSFHQAKENKSSEVNQKPKPKTELSSIPQRDLKEQSVRFLRHLLQRACLKDNYEDKDLVDRILSVLETKTISCSEIQDSKIGKLLRHCLNHPIPDTQFDLKHRMRDLALKFKAALERKPASSHEHISPKKNASSPPDAREGLKTPSLSPDLKNDITCVSGITKKEEDKEGNVSPKRSSPFREVGDDINHSEPRSNTEENKIKRLKIDSTQDLEIPEL